MKGHQNKPQTPRILPRGDRAPGFEIPGSATDISISQGFLIQSAIVFYIVRSLTRFCQTLVIKIMIYIIYIDEGFPKKRSTCSIKTLCFN